METEARKVSRPRSHGGSILGSGEVVPPTFDRASLRGHDKQLGPGVMGTEGKWAAPELADDGMVGLRCQNVGRWK